LTASVLQIRGGVHRYAALNAGLLDQLGKYARKYLPCETCAIISDTNVAPLFADRVRKAWRYPVSAPL
jgi:hypothetical protein